MDQRSIRQRRRKRKDGTVRLNITSMIDMFTLMVVFLLKNYSAQGQLVTPAKDLRLPVSSIEKMATEALSLKVTENSISIENTVVVDPAAYKVMTEEKDFLIEPLYKVLKEYSSQAKRSAEMFHSEFSGKISIQGDVEIPYHVLTKIMYTSGQAGYPVMNLIVYRKG